VKDKARGDPNFNHLTAVAEVTVALFRFQNHIFSDFLFWDFCIFVV